MTRARGVYLVIGLLVVMPAIAAAQVYRIDFDQDPAGNSIAAGTVINTVYASMGVTFERVNASPSSTAWKVYANDDQPAGFGSPPNVVSLYGSPSASDVSEKVGLIRAVFETPASTVCIGFRPNSATYSGVIRAFDAAGAKLAEKMSGHGVTGDICVSAFRIHHVEFSGAGDGWGRFDNLQVTLGAGPVAGPFYIGATANQRGVGTTAWVTDLEVLNRGTTKADFTVELLRWNQANPAPSSNSYSLEPGMAMRYPNALATIFSYSGGATLRLTGVGGSIVANARTYNNDPGGTYGQYIPALTLEQAVQPGMTRHLLHLSQSATDTTGFRTNLGLVSASPFGLMVRARFFSSAGKLLVIKTYSLRAYESIQILKVFLDVGAGAVADGYIELSSETAGATFFGYASVVDNRTGDGVHIPAV